MSKSNAVRSGDVAYNGSGVVTANLGNVTNSASAANGAFFVVPFDCYVAEVTYNITTGFTHASSAFGIGDIASAASIVASTNIQNQATGVVSLTADASFVSAAARKLTKGQNINLNLAAADTTGKIGAVMVLVPRQD